MPHSSPEGKPWISAWIAELKPARILDIGAGAGVYGQMARATLPAVHLAAMEIWRPYIAGYGLQDLYDQVIVADARVTLLPPADVVILGDILEHMTRTEAAALWNKARRAARMAVFTSLPIVPYPQAPEIGGNPHERHVVPDWTHQQALAAFPGIIASETGTEIGVYMAGGAAE
ncbi:Methyltransferase domain-containing protein [Frankia sp. AiPs1]|uniref:class I SAM-dependent methyltransferase n=1 Tax=Frankia sp. AiPa1 TaxID=573492 RepID=UPI00202B705D|nr:class I SAM-dependent methyltransferase [Frankia sp. AiPa1]MCL9761544.1 class I SAM-dependent methyltransferase [Frankia sp. AiPa1]